jgi:hypothetical protein
LSNQPTRRHPIANRLGDIKTYKDRKADLKEANNALVKRPIQRLDDSIVSDIKKHRQGRKKKYTPTKIKNAINSYFTWCETEDELPSIKGLMIHLKMYKDQFYQYLQYPEFTDIMEHARLIISNWCETDVYNTQGIAAGKIAYMKNLHAWADKVETKNETTQVTLTAEQARARIELLAPKLLEVLKSNTTLLQLAERKEETKTIEAEVVEPRRI